jgi:hypothetical protein
VFAQLRRILLFALLVAGCGTSSEAPADLAVAPDDFALGDALATIEDMASSDAAQALFCAHLSAALAGGTPTDCAVEFMTRLMRCFQPAGACGSGSGTLPPSSVTSCWANGAVYERSYQLGSLGYLYAMNGRRCGVIDTDTGGPFSASLCASTAQYDCDTNASDMAGAGARYVGGTFSCTDGTQLAVGRMFDCAEIKQFLAPPCDGTVDAGGCLVP